MTPREAKAKMAKIDQEAQTIGSKYQLNDPMHPNYQTANDEYRRLGQFAFPNETKE